MPSHRAQLQPAPRFAIVRTGGPQWQNNKCSRAGSRVVTGAASGMGRVMARALAGAGARSPASTSTPTALERLAAEPVFAGKLCKIAGDVSQTAACRGAVRDGRRRVRRARHPDQLRRHQHVARGRAQAVPHQVLRGRSRGLAADPGDQLRRRVPDGAVRGRADGQARLGPHHQRDDELRHHAGGRALRLRRLQGRARSELREPGRRTSRAPA